MKLFPGEKKRISQLKFFIIFVIILIFLNQNSNKFITLIKSQFNKEAPDYTINLIDKSYFQSINKFSINLNTDFGNLTMSASAENRINLIIILLTSLLSFFNRKKFHKKSKIFLFFIVLSGNFFLLRQFDDLPDEAYVWASKIDTLLQNGKVGVPLFDNTYGESTVGLLQFILASLPRYFGLTVEQSLLIPLWITFTIAICSVYYLFLTKFNSSLFAGGMITLIYLNPILGLNFSNAFDNVMAFSLLLIWITCEIARVQEEPPNFRFVLMALFPLVRLDFLIVSLGILGFHLIDTNLLSRKHVLLELKKNFFRYLLVLVVAAIFIFYKYWAFGDLIPAMATYKSGQTSRTLIEDGFLYLVEAMQLKEFFFVFIVIVVFFFSFKKSTGQGQFVISSKSESIDEKKLFRLIFFNAVFLIFVTFFTLTGGGDYFGYSFFRYQFPFLMTIFILLAFWLLCKLKNSNAEKLNFRKNLNVFAAISLVTWFTFILFKPEQISLLVQDVKSIDSGRATCDAAAAYAVKSKFSQLNTVATPEVNGFAYHANLKLIDLIGLVDTRLNKEFVGVEPSSKYRIYQSKDSIEQTDVLWLYGSAVCNSTDLKNLDPSLTLKSLINKFPGNFRVANYNLYIQSGFKPVTLSFTFKVFGEIKQGNAYLFINSARSNYLVSN